ncbi:FAD binding domain-containing protein [Polynucleobacter sp. MWH-HuK1]|uniref:FAD binding domain-containing protein n=1 Tax=Polynucleobacter sp. MWH-HuK1 TaxID=1743158 RepID=UPI001C0D18AE|nr:FAD binding domain-containing protein [Polynucleobacter sp. MWH-HuK1]MBU3566276.1 FAD-dependent monooxygenase [Polynucleobacter sp. MWH-HuK1]
MAKILVAGGSLGGLFAANILLRQGHDVTLLEKTVGSLDGRGAGIVTHDALAEALRAAGVAVDETLGVSVNKRVTLGADGQSLGEMELPQVLTSWSRLYHMLKEGFPSERYLQGKTVKTVTQDESTVHVLCEDGSKYDGELLIASDGIRSAVRAQVAPQIQPEYAGYIAWRGVCDEACLSKYTLETLFNQFGFCLPNGEQMLGYPVAGSGNDTRPGKRRYNFVWYRPASEHEELVSLLTDDDGNHYPTGIPPLKVSWRHIAHMRKVAQEILAPQYAEILEKTAAPFLQAIYDVRSEQIVFDRIALMGDAAFVGRPHVGMGVTKAGDEAMVIAKHIAALGATPAALKAYSDERLKLGQQVVARAQYLGRYMQAQGSKGNRDNEKLKRNADTVMAETAIDISELLAQGKAVPEYAH